jgi:hypothetical protein
VLVHVGDTVVYSYTYLLVELPLCGGDADPERVRWVWDRCFDLDREARALPNHRGFLPDQGACR